jgi:hypothetical protein
MYHPTEPPRQKSLTTVKLVTDVPHSSRQEYMGTAFRLGDDCPAFSLMERVFTFLDHYRAAEGSVPRATRPEGSKEFGGPHRDYMTHDGEWMWHP